MEFVKRMNLRMDDLMNELLVKIYSADDEYLEYIMENQSTIFRYSLLEIMNNIYDLVKSLNDGYNHQSITLYVNNYLVKNSLSVADNPYFGSCTEEKFLEEKRTP